MMWLCWLTCICVQGVDQSRELQQNLLFEGGKLKSGLPMGVYAYLSPLLGKDSKIITVRKSYYRYCQVKVDDLRTTNSE